MSERRSRRTRGERPEVVPPKSDEEPNLEDDYVDKNGNKIALGALRGRRKSTRKRTGSGATSTSAASSSASQLEAKGTAEDTTTITTTTRKYNRGGGGRRRNTTRSTSPAPSQSSVSMSLSAGDDHIDDGDDDDDNDENRSSLSALDAVDDDDNDDSNDENDNSNDDERDTEDDAPKKALQVTSTTTTGNSGRKKRKRKKISTTTAANNKDMVECRQCGTFYNKFGVARHEMKCMPVYVPRGAAAAAATSAASQASSTSSSSDDDDDDNVALSTLMTRKNKASAVLARSYKCRNCGRLFAPQGIKRHERKCMPVYTERPSKLPDIKRPANNKEINDDDENDDNDNDEVDEDSSNSSSVPAEDEDNDLVDDDDDEQDSESTGSSEEKKEEANEEEKEETVDKQQRQRSKRPRSSASQNNNLNNNINNVGKKSCICRQCGKEFSPQGITKHEKSCMLVYTRRSFPNSKKTIKSSSTTTTTSENNNNDSNSASNSGISQQEEQAETSSPLSVVVVKRQIQGVAKNEKRRRRLSRHATTTTTTTVTTEAAVRARIDGDKSKQDGLISIKSTSTAKIEKVSVDKNDTDTKDSSIIINTSLSSTPPSSSIQVITASSVIKNDSDKITRSQLVASSTVASSESKDFGGDDKTEIVHVTSKPTTNDGSNNDLINSKIIAGKKTKNIESLVSSSIASQTLGLEDTKSTIVHAINTHTNLQVEVAKNISIPTRLSLPPTTAAAEILKKTSPDVDNKVNPLKKVTSIHQQKLKGEDREAKVTDNNNNNEYTIPTVKKGSSTMKPIMSTSTGMMAAAVVMEETNGTTGEIARGISSKEEKEEKKASEQVSDKNIVDLITGEAKTSKIESDKNSFKIQNEPSLSTVGVDEKQEGGCCPNETLGGNAVITTRHIQQRILISDTIDIPVPVQNQDHIVQKIETDHDENNDSIVVRINQTKDDRSESVSIITNATIPPSHDIGHTNSTNNYSDRSSFAEKVMNASAASSFAGGAQYEPSCNTTKCNDAVSAAVMLPISEDRRIKKTESPKSNKASGETEGKKSMGTAQKKHKIPQSETVLNIQDASKDDVNNNSVESEQFDPVIAGLSAGTIKVTVVEESNANLNSTNSSITSTKSNDNPRTTSIGAGRNDNLALRECEIPVPAVSEKKKLIAEIADVKSKGDAISSSKRSITNIDDNILINERQLTINKMVKPLGNLTLSFDEGINSKQSVTSHSEEDKEAEYRKRISTSDNVIGTAVNDTSHSLPTRKIHSSIVTTTSTLSSALRSTENGPTKMSPEKVELKSVGNIGDSLSQSILGKKRPRSADSLPLALRRKGSGSNTAVDSGITINKMDRIECDTHVKANNLSSTEQTEFTEEDDRGSESFDSKKTKTENLADDPQQEKTTIHLNDPKRKSDFVELIRTEKDDTNKLQTHVSMKSRTIYSDFDKERNLNDTPVSETNTKERSPSSPQNSQHISNLSIPYVETIDDEITMVKEYSQTNKTTASNEAKTPVDVKNTDVDECVMHSSEHSRNDKEIRKSNAKISRTNIIVTAGSSCTNRTSYSETIENAGTKDIGTAENCIQNVVNTNAMHVTSFPGKSEIIYHAIDKKASSDTILTSTIESEGKIPIEDKSKLMEVEENTTTVTASNEVFDEPRRIKNETKENKIKKSESSIKNPTFIEAKENSEYNASVDLDCSHYEDTQEVRPKETVHRKTSISVTSAAGSTTIHSSQSNRSETIIVDGTLSIDVTERVGTSSNKVEESSAMTSLSQLTKPKAVHTSVLLGTNAVVREITSCVIDMDRDVTMDSSKNVERNGIVDEEKNLIVEHDQEDANNSEEVKITSTVINMDMDSTVDSTNNVECDGIVDEKGKLIIKHDQEDVDNIDEHININRTEAKRQLGKFEHYKRTTTMVEVPDSMHPKNEEESKVKLVVMSKLKPTPNAIPNSSDINPFGGESKMNRIKVLLYTAGSQIHRGRGFERIFSMYWDALCRRLSGPQSISVSTQCDRVIAAYLKTKRLRKIHNKLVMGIMRRAMKTVVPYANLAGHIPTQWQSRVKVPQVIPSIKASENKIAKLYKPFKDFALDIASVPHVDDDSPYKEQWEMHQNTVDEMPQISQDGLIEQSKSSPIPGALVIDPLLRNIAKENGMEVTDDSMWVLTIALKEHVKNILSGSIRYKQGIEKAEIYPQSLNHPNLLSSVADKIRKEKKLKGKPSASIVAKTAIDGQKKQINSMDIFSALNMLPAGRVGSTGGSVSTTCLEQIFFSAFNSIPLFSPGNDISYVQSFVSGTIIDIAKTRKPEDKKTRTSHTRLTEKKATTSRQPRPTLDENIAGISSHSTLFPSVAIQSTTLGANRTTPIYSPAFVDQISPPNIRTPVVESDVHGVISPAKKSLASPLTVNRLSHSVGARPIADQSLVGSESVKSVQQKVVPSVKHTLVPTKTSYEDENKETEKKIEAAPKASPSAQRSGVGRGAKNLAALMARAADSPKVPVHEGKSDALNDGTAIESKLSVASLTKSSEESELSQLTKTGGNVTDLVTIQRSGAGRGAKNFAALVARAADGPKAPINEEKSTAGNNGTAIENQPVSAGASSTMTLESNQLSQLPTTGGSAMDLDLATTQRSGVGRGAKNLAALMARAVESQERPIDEETSRTVNDGAKIENKSMGASASLTKASDDVAS